MPQTAVTLITAHKLSAAQRQQILTLLKTKVGSVKLTETIDPAVLGGLQIQIGSQTFDASLAGKLEKLDTQLSEIIVTTAVPLTAAQEKEIKTAFSKQYGEIALRNVIDESIIGGVKLQYGSRELDATVKGKLSQLQTNMLASV